MFILEIKCPANDTMWKKKQKTKNQKKKKKNNFKRPFTNFADPHQSALKVEVLEPLFFFHNDRYKREVYLKGQ